jgi:NTE family protein
MRRRGGLLKTAGLERMVTRSTPWRRIRKNLAAGRLEALSVSATHVATGRTVVFVDRRGGGLPPWSRDRAVAAEPAAIGPLHVLASAAIPAVFPAVAVNGTYYSDGGLRQNTPLSPALRLGADRVLVISLKYLPTEREEAAQGKTNIEAFPSPWFLLGKSLNALLMDHTDYDLDRLRRINAIVEDGVRAFGPRFIEELDKSSERMRGQPLRVVTPLLIRPSRDLGLLAGEYVRSPKMRDLRGLHGRLVRYVASLASPTWQADLLAYLLFDDGFAAELIELGHRDARTHEEELAAFFGAQPLAALG